MRALRARTRVRGDGRVPRRRRAAGHTSGARRLPEPGMSVKDTGIAEPVRPEVTWLCLATASTSRSRQRPAMPSTPGDSECGAVQVRRRSGSALARSGSDTGETRSRRRVRTWAPDDFIRAWRNACGPWSRASSARTRWRAWPLRWCARERSSRAGSASGTSAPAHRSHPRRCSTWHRCPSRSSRPRSCRWRPPGTPATPGSIWMLRSSTGCRSSRWPTVGNGRSQPGVC